MWQVRRDWHCNPHARRLRKRSLRRGTPHQDVPKEMRPPGMRRIRFAIDVRATPGCRTCRGAKGANCQLKTRNHNRAGPRALVSRRRRWRLAPWRGGTLVAGRSTSKSIGAASMHEPGVGRAISLYHAILQGGAVGASAGALFAQHLSGDAGMIVFGAALGACTGFVCGLLTWIGSAELPEARIPPAHRPDAARLRMPQG